jgi:hypothetical protein
VQSWRVPVGIIRLQDKSSAEDRRDEDNGAANEGSHAEVGAQRGTSALAGGRRWRRTARCDGTVSLTSQARSSRTSVLATITLEPRAGSATALEVDLGILGEGRELVGAHSNVPGAGLGGALGSGAARLVATIAGRGRGLCVSSLKNLEVVKLGDGVAAESNESVLGLFLGVFVDETTGVDGTHVAAVERRDLVELAGILVAAKFRQASGC